MRVRTWHFDALLCALFATASAWMLWVARVQAAGAVRQYGFNVDSGALEYAAVVVFLLTSAVLFGAAAFAGAREWRLGRYVHWLAVVAAICPIAYGAIASAYR
jgi:hypothetical protein